MASQGPDGGGNRDYHSSQPRFVVFLAIVFSQIPFDPHASRLKRTYRLPYSASGLEPTSVLISESSC